MGSTRSKPEARSFIQIAHVDEGDQGFGPHSAALQGHWQGATREVEHLGYKQVSIWDIGAVGSGLAYRIITLALEQPILTKECITVGSKIKYAMSVNGRTLQSIEV